MVDLHKNLISFNEAKKIMLNTIKINRIETIDFEFSQDRVLAEDQSPIEFEQPLFLVDPS